MNDKMVRLKKLEMKGFKSFSSKTEIPFPEGFNAICGPNGAGKSNVGDAIIFALGTLSTNALRVDRLEDLVFSGNKDVNEARVSIYIDNEDREIPKDEDMIKVTRKVNQKGNSIYKLNGKTTTRRKLIDFLSHARLYSDGHNIIMQGDVTKLIEMNPEERREIIDEISGIAEFEDKKEKTERELEKVKEKLKEASLLLGEKEKNLKKLEKEKEDAKKYQKLEEEAKKLEASIVKKNLESKKKKLDKTNKELDEIEENLKESKNKLEEIDKKLEERDVEIDKLKDEIFDKGKDEELIEKIHQVRSKIEQNKNEIKSDQREIDRIEKTLKRMKLFEDRKFKGSKAVKKILNQNRKEVYGRVRDLIEVENKFARAIEIAGGGRLENLVVENDEVAKDCIEYLKRNKIGRATFLPLNKLKPKPKHGKELLEEEGVIDFAVNLVKFDSKYKKAINYTFTDTLVVENLETARKFIGKARMVSLDGDLVSKSGAMTGGKRKKFKKSNEMEKRKYKDKIKELKGKLKERREKIGELNQELAKLQDKKEEESGEITNLEKKRKELEEELKEKRLSRKDLYEEKMNLENKRNKLRVERAKLSTEIENLEEKFEELEIKDLFDQNLSEMRKEKKEKEKELKKLGPVNLRALKEFKHVETIYKDLKSKVDRIKSEKEEILKTVNRIEEKRERTFMKTFNKVNENFAEIFKELTNGEAELKLEEEDNIRSGLLIRANPKEKKTLSLDSMSGGEKSITALAFLFSIQQHKPAPFYILDEIDATLDKKNSKKIGELIKKFSKEAQFISITHNDITIKMADRVYGVSMENGASKVLTLEMPED